MQVEARLLVNRDEIGTRIGEGRQKPARFVDHQVGIYERLRARPEGPCHREPGREIRHEAAVHHVQLEPARASLLGFPHVLSETGVVGGQHRRGDHDPFWRVHAVEILPAECDVGVTWVMLGKPVIWGKLPGVGRTDYCQTLWARQRESLAIWGDPRSFPARCG